MAVSIVRIESFDPYTYAVPAREKFVGSIKILLPPVHLNVMDFGPLVPEAHFGADVDGPGFDVEGIEEPGITRTQLIEFLEKSKDAFREVWELTQQEYTKRGAILGSIFER